jgi:aminoglycoside phosphotransferase (APT) family kinase protein
VIRIRRLTPGVAAEVDAVDVLDAAGRKLQLVLKRFPVDDPSEPMQAAREARILRLVENGDVSTPRLVALDADGSRADVPAILMTRLPGRVVLRPRALWPWLRRLAELLPAIHSLPVAAAELPPYRPYSLSHPAQVPRWTRDRGAWQEAWRIFQGPRPAEPACFIHRDYHPGNVLWTGARPSGVVDWLHGSWGPPAADVGHCRLNLWELHGREAADAFLGIYRSLVPQAPPYQPYWDLAAALGGFDDHVKTKPLRTFLDDLVIAAVRRSV